MKKILLLGGSAQQVIAIETAKRLGYYTVLCDYLPDNPGQYKADKFYLVSTTDKDAVLEVAKKENIDGVLAYASDPAAPTAAYVAEQLGLPGNPYESVCTLCDKGRFRDFLKANGFATPYANHYSDLESLKADTAKFKLPVIIKPVDSSGSKGATVLDSWDNVGEAFEYAISFSRAKRVVAEEFIVKKHPYLIGGDIFVSDGKVILWGLLNCHRDENVNPLVPVGKSYPPKLGTDDMENVKNVLRELVDKLHISSGAMNVELIIDRSDRVYLIDIGPRSGGNMIPDLLGYIFNTDIVEQTVLSAMGQNTNKTYDKGECFYATHNLHSDRNGIFSDVLFSEEIEKYIIKKCIYKKPGDEAEYFDYATKALGIVFMKFDSEEEMDDILDNISESITIKLSEQR